MQEHGFGLGSQDCKLLQMGAKEEEQWEPEKRAQPPLQLYFRQQHKDMEQGVRAAGDPSPDELLYADRDLITKICR